MDAIYRRAFLKCRNCGYMVTTLAQYDRQLFECPSCEEMDLDYAPETDAIEYARDLQEELAFMFNEMKSE